MGDLQHLQELLQASEKQTAFFQGLVNDATNAARMREECETLVYFIEEALPTLEAHERYNDWAKALKKFKKALDEKIPMLSIPNQMAALHNLKEKVEPIKKEVESASPIEAGKLYGVDELPSKEEVLAALENFTTLFKLYLG